MDPILVTLTIALVALVVFNARITRLLQAADNDGPSIVALRSAFIVSLAITVGVLCGVLLGLNTIFLRQGWPRFLPMEVTLPLLLAAIVAPSIGNWYRWRKLKGLRSVEAAAARNRRVTDRETTP